MEADYGYGMSVGQELCMSAMEKGHSSVHYETVRFF